MRKINLYATGSTPHELEELASEDGHLRISIYTVQEAKTIPWTKLEKEGIEEDDNGGYNIAIAADQITEDNIRTALDNLTKQTGIEYILHGQRDEPQKKNRRIKTAPRKTRAQAKQE